MSHEALKEELLKPQNGPAAQKHLKQQVSSQNRLTTLIFRMENTTRTHKEGPVGEWFFFFKFLYWVNQHVSAREGPLSGLS